MEFRESPEEGSVNYLKLKDKEMVVGVFKGQPYEYYQHWIGDRTGKSVPCEKSSDKSCPHCAKTVKRQFRFKVNFVQFTDYDGKPSLSPKIFQGSAKTYNLLKQLNTHNYDLAKSFSTITRTGTEQSTDYIIAQHKKGAVNSDWESKLNAITLHNLAPEGLQKVPESSFNNADDLPF